MNDTCRILILGKTHRQTFDTLLSDISIAALKAQEFVKSKDANYYELVGRKNFQVLKVKQIFQLKPLVAESWTVQRDMKEIDPSLEWTGSSETEESYFFFFSQKIPKTGISSNE